MTHTTPVWKSTNFTGKHNLTPKELAAQRRINGLEPCPSPPNANGFCGSQRQIYDLTGKLCEAKSEGIHHERAAEICRQKKELLR